jgi:drug/metabolite transporter (DMT)-like permease
MKFAVLFVSIFSSRIADCLWVTVNKHASMVFNMLPRSLITTILFLLLSITTFLLGVNDYIPLSFHSGVIAIAICMLCYGGQFFYIGSLKYSTVSTSITIIGVTRAILSLVISVFFYKEHCDSRTIVCVLITMAGFM